MKTEQKKWTELSGWENVSNQNLTGQAELVLVFGSTKVLRDGSHYTSVKNMYPGAHVIMCSTAGEILDNEVLDDSMSLTAIQFEKTKLEFTHTSVDNSEQSKEAGATLAKTLPQDKLIHCMVFSEGLKVNGTALVSGLIENLPKNVSITGGLVGDGANFKETLVGLDSPPTSGNIVLIGFYGESLKVGYGSLGGWDPFGPERLITKSKNNVLLELDGQPALKLYKEYLGEQAKDLPGSGLLFPLSLSLPQDSGTTEVVRTVLSVNEADQSVTFAGDMPEGVYAKLMKANFDRLIDGAENAASMSKESLVAEQADLAILVSCIGRKLVLKERVEEEIEAVRGILGPGAAIAGFYSYGEICPTAATEKQCQLHNQTMTITTFHEV